ADKLLNGLQVAIFYTLGKFDFLIVREKGSLCDFPKIESDGVIDEVRVEFLKYIQITLKVGFFVVLWLHLRSDFFRNIRSFLSLTRELVALGDIISGHV